MSVLLGAKTKQENAQAQPLWAYLENSESSTGNTYCLDGNNFCGASKEQE